MPKSCAASPGWPPVCSSAWRMRATCPSRGSGGGGSVGPRDGRAPCSSGKIGEPEHWTFADDEGVLDDVAQLADVARPVASVRRRAAAVAMRSMRRELRPLSSRMKRCARRMTSPPCSRSAGNEDRHDAQAVHQVGARSDPPRPRPAAPCGWRRQCGHRRESTSRPPTGMTVWSQDAQQLGLHIERHLGHFVEKQRAAGRQAKVPGLSWTAPVNDPRT